MLNIIGGEDSELSSTANTIICPEGRTISVEPFAIDDRTDRVIVEVVYRTSVLLTDHIDVALQDELDTIFVAWGGRLAHDDVPHFVLLVFNTVVVGELLKVSDDLLFLLRWTRYLCDFMEVLPDNRGL